MAISTSTILTNAHVVAGSDHPILVRSTDGRELTASLLSLDTELDLALLDVPGLDAEPVRFGTPEAGAVVQIAAVDGDGQLAPVQTTVSRVLNVTSGDIYDEGDVDRVGVELASDIEPGSSGAGVFDADGHVVGIVFADSRERSVSYAVAAQEVVDFLDMPPDGDDRGKCD